MDFAGEIDAALVSFDHAAADRPLRWDLATAQWISAHTRHIAETSRRGIVERVRSPESMWSRKKTT